MIEAGMPGIHLAGCFLSGSSILSNSSKSFIDTLSPAGDFQESCLSPPPGISKGHAFVVISSFGDIS